MLVFGIVTILKRSRQTLLSSKLSGKVVPRPTTISTITGEFSNFLSDIHLI